MVEVHVPLSGWTKFKRANAWAIGDDGTLRLVKVGPKPDYAFKQWVAVFVPGGWQGIATEDADEVPRYGFRPTRP